MENLDEKLCLALYTASRAMTARYRPILSQLSLTYPQYLVISLLGEQGAATVSQIGEKLRLESSTLSPLLKRLEAMSLITRTRNSEDERSVTVELTLSGEALGENAVGIPEQIGASVGISLREQKRLVVELRALASALDESLGNAKEED